MNPALPQRFDWRALPALVAGLILLCGFDDIGGFVLAVVPGSLLLATAVGVLLWPGQATFPRHMALGAVLGVILGIPALFVDGPAFGIVTIILSIAAYLCAGRIGLQQADAVADAPQPPEDWKTDAKAALDEALMGYFASTASIPDGQRAAEVCEHIQRTEQVLQTAAWATPEAFNPAPPAPADASLAPIRKAGINAQHLCFSSDYKPPEELPGAPDWLTGSRNGKCHALVFRQAQAGRPWLLAIHGYRMGADWLNLVMFPPKTLVTHLRFNLVVPTLPLHGRRKEGWRTGDYYLDGPLLGFLFAQAQALWDLRRTIAWIRQQDPQARIGVIGYSLGGYNTALLAAQDDGLDFAVAGIPVADLFPLLWQNLPQPHRRYFTEQGFDEARFSAIVKLVSPLALAPKLPPERLGIFAGSADRLVTPDQPLRLAEHWQVPVNWYPGGHLTFRGEPAVTDTLKAAVVAAGWADLPV